MKFKQLLNNKFLKASALMGLSLFTFSTYAQTNITVDAGDAWMGGMLVYENNATQDYLWFSDWGLADVKTELNTTTNTVTLYPNYNVYVPTDAYWANGEIGNKVMQGMSYVLNDALLGQQFTFSGNVESNTLATGYVGKAFIKTLDANYGLINETIADLDAGNFTISYDATQYPDAVHVQYGFSVRGLNANPTAMAANGNIVVTADEPEVGGNPGGESTIVDVDATAAWTGAMLVYDNTPEQPYLFYSDWGVADVKTDINTTSNTVTLYPNYNVYSPTDTYWSNGEAGNKIMLGISYVLDDTLLGEQITFTGNVSSYTLSNAYTAKAFVKVLDANFGLINEVTADITSTGNFAVNYNSAAYPTAVHLQYGFMVRGINANPVTMAQNGNVVIGSATAGTDNFTKKEIVLYPNPAANVLNITSKDIVDSVEIFNMLGQKVIAATPKNNTATIDVSTLKGGIYTVNTIVSGKLTSSRFIKQ